MVRNQHRAVMTVALVVGMAAFGSIGEAQDAHTSKRFTGAKVNEGTVTHVHQSGAHVLKLSPEFKVPGTPAPLHWDGAIPRVTRWDGTSLHLEAPPRNFSPPSSSSQSRSHRCSF